MESHAVAALLDNVAGPVVDERVGAAEKENPGNASTRGQKVGGGREKSKEVPDSVDLSETEISSAKSDMNSAGILDGNSTSDILTPRNSSKLESNDNLKADSDASSRAPSQTSFNPLPFTANPKPSPFSYAKAAVREHAPREKGSESKKPARVITHKQQKQTARVVQDPWADPGAATTPSNVTSAPVVDSWFAQVNSWGPGVTTAADSWDATPVSGEPEPVKKAVDNNWSVTSKGRRSENSRKTRDPEQPRVTEGWGPQNNTGHDWSSPEQRKAQAQASKGGSRLGDQKNNSRRSNDSSDSNSNARTNAWVARDPAPHVGPGRNSAPQSSKREGWNARNNKPLDWSGRHEKTRAPDPNNPRDRKRSDWGELRKQSQTWSQRGGRSDKPSAAPAPTDGWGTSINPLNSWGLTQPTVTTSVEVAGDGRNAGPVGSWATECESPAEPQAVLPAVAIDSAGSNPWGIPMEELKPFDVVERVESRPPTRDSKRSKNSKKSFKPSPPVVTSGLPSSGASEGGQIRPTSASPVVLSNLCLPAVSSVATQCSSRTGKASSIRANAPAFVPRFEAPFFKPSAVAAPFVPRGGDLDSWRRDFPAADPSSTGGVEGIFTSHNEVTAVGQLVSTHVQASPQAIQTSPQTIYYDPRVVVAAPTYPQYAYDPYTVQQQYGSPQEAAPYIPYHTAEGHYVSPLLVSGAFTGMGTYPAANGSLAPIQLLPGGALYPQPLSDFMAGADLYPGEGHAAWVQDGGLCWGRPESKAIRITSERDVHG